MVAVFVVTTIVVFVAMDLIVQFFERRKLASPISSSTLDNPWATDLTLPMGYFFHPGHTWAKLEKTGEVEVGLDDFTRKLMGSIEGIELPETGRAVQQGEPLFRIKKGRRTATFVSPVNGVISSVNRALGPETVGREPYGSGWVVKVESDTLADDLSKLKIGKDAVRWMKKEINRFLDFSWNQMPAPAALGRTAQDGGFPVEGILGNMDEDAWSSFVKEFLYEPRA